MGSGMRKTVKQKVAERLLDAALRVFVHTVDTVKFVAKMRRRYKARR
jgi:hypothetical protein